MKSAFIGELSTSGSGQQVHALSLTFTRAHQSERRVDQTPAWSATLQQANARVPPCWQANGCPMTGYRLDLTYRHQAILLTARASCTFDSTLGHLRVVTKTSRALRTCTSNARLNPDACGSSWKVG